MCLEVLSNSLLIFIYSSPRPHCRVCSSWCFKCINEAYICYHKQTYLNCNSDAHVTQSIPYWYALGTGVFKELCVELREIFSNTEGGCDVPCFPLYAPPLYLKTP